MVASREINEAILGAGSTAIRLPILDFVESSFEQNVARLTQSPEGQRDSQAGLLKQVFASFHSGGLRPKIMLGNWSRDVDKIGYSEGIQTHIYGGAYLPYLLQVQSQITSGENMSGFRAANHRWHPLNTTLGGSAYRYVVALGEAIYRDVSTSDHSLEVATTSGLTAANYTGFGALQEVYDTQAAGLRVLLGLKNTANSEYPIQSCSDVTAGTMAWTDRSYSQTSGQYVFGIDQPTNITGFVFLYGRLDWGAGNLDGLHYSADLRVSGSGGSGAQMVDIPLGGFSMGESPWTANRIGYVTPIKDELTTVVVPRVVTFADYTSVPAVTISYPQTDLDHVEHACWFAGGLACAGDTLSGVATRITLVDSGGTVRDLAFPGLNGTTEYGAVNLQPAGRVLIVTVSKSDGSNGQDWYFDLSTGAWHASCALLTLADTPGGIPIGCGRAEMNKNQRRRYTFTPDGGDSTKTNVYRQFQPRDLFANPMLSNTSEKFHFGDVKLRGVQLDTFGPTESNKALTRMIYGSRYASTTGGSYGTVVAAVATDGNQGTFTSAASNTFDTAFESYDIPASGDDYGLVFKTLIPQFTLSNGGTTEGNAETTTPNALPLILEGVASWPKLSEFTLVLNMAAILAKYRHTTGFTAALKALENVSADLSGGQPTMRFQMGRFDGVVAISSYKLRGTPTNKDSVLVVRQVRQ